MCMFSSESPNAVRYVGRTRILAGARPDGRQVLVYSMSVAAREPVAMILPIPVPPSSGEDALRFIDLKGYPRFFDDLDTAFGLELECEANVSRSLGAPQSAGRPRLKVHAVGDFEASFVPTKDDFDRLDPRFRLSDRVWDELPGYHDHGFAVFQLEDGPPRRWWRSLFRRPEPRTIHPMAFSFPRRDRAALFFPTVHVHHGSVRAQATFDHQLYAQLLAGEAPVEREDGWRQSTRGLSEAVDMSRVEDVVESGRPGWKRTMTGSFPNADVYVHSCR